MNIISLLDKSLGGRGLAWCWPLLILLPLQPVMAESDGDEALFHLSLEELLQVQITSVSKRTQSLSEAAAAVFVITQDDLRRSGVETIPDALRMVPGVQVAQVGASQWAITARGFNSRFANKLLVLIDGRSVYTPLFSGVFWDIQDTLIEDIDRIEVIRGPGSTLWGSNAVNGVINIITRNASETHGGRLIAAAGSETRGSVSLRYGGRAGTWDYRVFAKGFERDGSRLVAGGEAGDDWGMTRIGFRMDRHDAGNELMFSGELYDGRAGEVAVRRSITAPFEQSRWADTDLRGGHLLARWKHELNAAQSFKLQTYLVRTDRRWTDFIGEARDTLDLDFQFNDEHWRGHRVVWGLGYRYTQGDIDQTDNLFLRSDNRHDSLYSGFIQDEITLQPGRWLLTLGSKFEHNDYSGFEYQPSARLTWLVADNQTLWAAVSRAVHTPSRLEHDTRIALQMSPPGSPSNPLPVPLLLQASGDRSNGSETLIASEFGYRWQATTGLGLDATAFFNKYHHLRSIKSSPAVCAPVGGSLPACLFTPGNNFALIPGLLDDAGRAETYGLELAVDWQVMPRWRLKGAYSYFRLHMHVPSGQIDQGEEDNSPQHQFSLRSQHDLPHHLEADFWLRSVDRISLNAVGNVGSSIPGYTELDVRFGWHPRPDLELSLSGRNLLHSRHAEFISDQGSLPPLELQRSFLIKLDWSF